MTTRNLKFIVADKVKQLITDQLGQLLGSDHKMEYVTETGVSLTIRVKAPGGQFKSFRVLIKEAKS